MLLTDNRNIKYVLQAAVRINAPSGLCVRVFYRKRQLDREKGRECELLSRNLAHRMLRFCYFELSWYVALSFFF